MALQLRPYQETAADFLYEHDRAMVLAPVGAGKTAITLTAMQDMVREGHVGRWLVLAPKRVCTDVWPVEAPKWASELHVSVAVGTPAQRLERLHSMAEVVVTNYDNIQWLAEQNLAMFEGIVFDELTKLKNPSGARFKALHKVIDQFTIRWGLTGSFTSNGLEDVFGQCKIIDQSLLGRSKGAFMQQYFLLSTYGGFDDWAPRPGALELVMKKIKPATFVLEPGEYKDKLPPCHVVEMRVDMQERKPYEDMKKTFVAELGGDLQAIAQNAAVVTQKLQQLASGFIYTEGTSVWTGVHKFEALEDLLQENQHANTIVVYQYQEELAELKRRFRQLTTLDDADAIARWNRGEVRLLAVHPKSAGHGLNLQHGGCHMVFLSLPWSLELYEQTVGRLHRSGQQHDVWVYLLMARDSIDEKIWNALHDKRAVSEIALESLK
jgi:SNF2 family DNA or RNA helicase